MVSVLVTTEHRDCIDGPLDGVPTILFKSLGYRHFANEYWHFDDPAKASNVRKCSGGDDPTCSDSIRRYPRPLFYGSLTHSSASTFINPAHIFYFGQVMAINPLLCI